MKKTMFLTMMFLLVVAAMPFAARAQDTQPSQGGAKAQAKGLENDPAFKNLSPSDQEWVRGMTKQLDSALERGDIKALSQLQLTVAHWQLSGSSFCAGHKVGEGTFLDATAQSESNQQQAYAERWLEPEPGNTVHSAVFTKARCIVSDGDTVDGRFITRVLPNSLGVSNRGLVAYEALYLDTTDKGTKRERRGAFIENRFAFELDPLKASLLNRPDVTDTDRDFRWNEARGALDTAPGVALAPMVPVSAKGEAKPGCEASAPDKKPRIGGIPIPLPAAAGVILSGRYPTTRPCPATPGK